MTESAGNAAGWTRATITGLRVRARLITPQRSIAGMAAVIGCLTIAGCTTEQAKVDPNLGVSPSERVVGENDAVPEGGGRYHIGKAYKIGSKTYVPAVPPAGYQITGVASWYGPGFHGRRTANGEVFDKTSISAAHPTMPLPSYIRVTNLQNGKSMIVRVNDRGPFHSRRVVDVSQRVAEMLEFRRMGSAKVKVEYIGPARLDGHDDAMMLASLRDPHQGPAPDPTAAPKTLMIASHETKTPVVKKPQPALVRLDGERGGRVVPAQATAKAAATAKPAPQRAVPVESAPAAADVEIAAGGVPVPAARDGAAPAGAAPSDLPMLASAEGVPGVAAAPATDPAAPALTIAAIEAQSLQTQTPDAQTLDAQALQSGGEPVDPVLVARVVVPLPKGGAASYAIAAAPAVVAEPAAVAEPAVVSEAAYEVAVAEVPAAPDGLALAAMPLPRPAAGSIDTLLAAEPAVAPKPAKKKTAPVAAAPVPAAEPAPEVVAVAPQAEPPVADAGRFEAPSSPSPQDADQLQALLARYVADGVIQ